MSWIPQLLAFVLLLLGVGFVVAAALGVLRFPDALQRMHASTKAGTLGAVLVLAGAMVALDADAVPVGVMTILFMLLTVPVAAHLLGRAAYVSGASLRLVMGRNALFGLLERQQAPLEERTNFVAYAPRAVLPSVIEPSTAITEISEVRLGLIAPEIEAPLMRALAIRKANDVPMRVLAIVDERFLNATGDIQGARSKVRANLTQAIEQMEGLLPKRRPFFSLVYEEGDPMRLIPSADDRDSLLVLPNSGWCDHGAGMPTPFATGRPEGLLRLADHHAGCILYTGRRPFKDHPLILVEDDGSDAILAGVEWALTHSIWQKPKLQLIDRTKQARSEIFGELAARFDGVLVPDRTQLRAGERLPAGVVHADALITTGLPGPKRADWYGMFWHDNIGDGWAGEVLLVPSQEKKL